LRPGLSRRRRDPRLKPLSVGQPDGHATADRLVDLPPGSALDGVRARPRANATEIGIGICAGAKAGLAGRLQGELILRKHVPDLGHQTRAVLPVGPIDQPDQIAERPGRPTRALRLMVAGKEAERQNRMDHHQRHGNDDGDLTADAAGEKPAQVPYHDASTLGLKR